MELDLQSLFGLYVHAQLYSWAETPQFPPPPAFRLIYEGAIGQPRKTTSLCDPLHQALGYCISRRHRKNWQPSEHGHIKSASWINVFVIPWDNPFICKKTKYFNGAVYGRIKFVSGKEMLTGVGRTYISRVSFSSSSSPSSISSAPSTIGSLTL